MRTPFSRRADAFADALDRAAAGAPAGSHAAGLDPLVRLAERLAAVPQRPVGGMPAAFRADLVASAAAPAAGLAPTMTASVPGSAAATSAVSGAATQAVAGVIAMTVAVTGIGAAATRSVSGDPLYGLRRITRGPVDPARTLLADDLAGSAAARLAELHALLASGPLDAAGRARVDRLVAELSSALDGVLDRLTADVAPDHVVAEVTEVWNGLAELVPALPAESQERALGVLATVDDRLAEVVSGAAPRTGTKGSQPTSPTPAPSDAPSAAPTAPLSVTPSRTPGAGPSRMPLPAGSPLPSSSTSAVTPTSLPVPQGDRTSSPLPVLPG